jgi:hypothetical protein
MGLPPVVDDTGAVARGAEAIVHPEPPSVGPPLRARTAWPQDSHSRLGFTADARHVGAVAVTRENPVRISLFGLIYLAIGVVVALTHGYNSVAGLSEILSLIIAVVLWPAVLFGVDLHLPAIAT